MLTHVANLPRESAYGRLLSNSPFWDEQAEATAAVYDAVSLLTHYYLSAHMEREPQRPAPYPRPSAVVAEPETSSLSDLSGWLKE